jgi:hypothetical protein
MASISPYVSGLGMLRSGMLTMALRFGIAVLLAALSLNCGRQPEKAQYIDPKADYNPKGSVPFVIAITVSDGPLRSVTEQAMQAEFSKLPSTKVLFGDEHCDLTVDVLVSGPASPGEPVAVATRASLTDGHARLINGKVILVTRHNTPYSDRRVVAEADVPLASAAVARAVAQKLVTPYLPEETAK